MSDAQEPGPDPRDAIFDTAHLKGNLGARAGRGSVLVLLFAALKFAVQIGTTAVLARLVPPSDHGIIAMAMPAILIGTSLSEFGLAEAVIQREKVTHKMASALFWTNLAIGLSLALIICLLALPATRFYDEPRVGPVFLALAPTIVLAAMAAQFVAILRRQMRVRQIETILLVANIASVLSAVALALLGFGYWAVAAQILLQPFFSFLQMARATGWRPSWPSRAAMAEARGVLSFGGLLAVSRLLSQFTQTLGMIAVGRAFSAVEAGYYYRSWTLANLPQQRAIGPLASVFLPAFSRAAEDGAALRPVFVRAATRIGLITVPVGIGLCAAADLVVALILGPQWADTAPLLAWFGILTLQSGAMYTLQWALVASGRADIIFCYRLFAAFVTAGALFIGLRFGISGMVAGYMLSLIGISLPVLGVLVTRFSTLRPGDLFAAFRAEIVTAIAGVAFVSLVRARLPDMALLAELALVMGLVLLVLAARVLPDAGLRADIGKVAGLVRRRGA